MPDLHSSWDLSLVTPPWGTRPSLYQHILTHLPPGDGGLLEDGEELPDQTSWEYSGGLRCVAGVYDVKFSPDTDEVTTTDTVLCYAALQALTLEASSAHAAECYMWLTNQRALAYLEPLQRMIIERHDLDRARLHVIALWLATGAADREAVKAGIAFLSMCYAEEDLPTLLLLGRHEEFTLFVATALESHISEPELLLWILAKQVTGWGRVILVKSLVTTAHPDIKAWLLREGFRNTVYENLALLCAESGDLLDALQAPQPDEALLRGAGEIIDTLLRPMQGTGISAYADGAEATERFLYHLRGRELDIPQLKLLHEIREFLDKPSAQRRVAGLGWAERRERMLALLASITSRPEWKPRVQAALSTPDRWLFHQAVEAALAVGLDCWKIVYQRLVNQDTSAFYWATLAETDNPVRMARLLALAELRLLGEMHQDGPLSVRDRSRQFVTCIIFNHIFAELRRFPGHGWPLVRAGLQFPKEYTRCWAIHVLSAWGMAHWPAEATSCLQAALEQETDEENRELLRKVLRGEPVEAPE